MPYGINQEIGEARCQLSGQVYNSVSKDPGEGWHWCTKDRRYGLGARSFHHAEGCKPCYSSSVENVIFAYAGFPLAWWAASNLRVWKHDSTLLYRIFTCANKHSNYSRVCFWLFPLPPSIRWWSFRWLRQEWFAVSLLVMVMQGSQAGGLCGTVNCDSYQQKQLNGYDLVYIMKYHACW